MFNLALKRSVAALAVSAGLLAAAGPASALLYDGHAGLGSNDALQVAGVADGTSNTLERTLLPYRPVSARIRPDLAASPRAW
jgi:hypothetical protein